MSEVEILAFMAGRKGRRVCAFMPVPEAAHHPKRWSGPRRWLLAVVAFLSGQQVSIAALPPQPLLVEHSLVGQNPGLAMVTIRGIVIDDSLNAPVAGARVYFGETRYGTISNELGEFSFSFPPDWGPARNGMVIVKVSGVPFTLSELTVKVNVEKSVIQPPLIVIRLPSVPQRGRLIGEAVMAAPPPVALPGLRNSRR